MSSDRGDRSRKISRLANSLEMTSVDISRLLALLIKSDTQKNTSQNERCLYIFNYLYFQYHFIFGQHWHELVAMVWELCDHALADVEVVAHVYGH